MGVGVKLAMGAAGIYGAFMYYGLLQEDVLTFRAEDGGQFDQVWMLQAFEAAANAILGAVGLALMGSTGSLPLGMFATTGLSQVSAKALTSLALAQGVSFPVMTLAKSAKMVPVMAGSLIMNPKNTAYEARQYAQAALIIAGTVIVSMAKKSSKAGAASSSVGLMCLLGALCCDGYTGGQQKALQMETKKRTGKMPTQYDLMFWINFFMTCIAFLVALALGELPSGIAFLTENPEILRKIATFSLCSAIGQNFIFFTIAEFDSLTCTTITTTRKIFSVLLSIFVKGHSLNGQGWTGIAVASAGILGELDHKLRKGKAPKAKKAKE
mmetsp:Transcript_31635/g.100461  ORF Transcript_31635/g.100461 Transcript_31635/m.100461 type:complete len:325 (-) Transcript_31635:119-1093(-)